MMPVEAIVDKWRNHPRLTEDLKKELNTLDDVQIEDAFYKCIEFGTGGMRGEIGVGPNRMNIYTVRKAAQGLANFAKERNVYQGDESIAIAYDSRHFSPEFAMETAKVLATNGIKAYLFDHICPTPILSFAIRYLRASGGVVITASHNPPEYNGFKVYLEDGCQIPVEAAKSLVSHVDSIVDELNLLTDTEDELRARNLIVTVPADVEDAYLEATESIRIHKEMEQETKDSLKIVFTPLHGTSLKAMTLGLQQWGFNHVDIVKEQAQADPEFSTVASPNPEEHAAFEYAIQYGKRQNADVLMGTDPDADRLGVAALNEKGEYEVLTGNQLGALLLDYIVTGKAEQGTLPNNGFVAKTIVTSELGASIAKGAGLHVVNTLTGFKFIGEQIRLNEGQHPFVFGYEESYGYLIGDFCRDKDAVQTGLLVAEMTAYWKGKGQTLYQRLESIWKQYGYYQESLYSLTLKGKAGSERIQRMMDFFRANSWSVVHGLQVLAVEDYLTGTHYDCETKQIKAMTLPKSNVIKIILANDSWFCLRPSGTEPKLKAYFSVRSESKEASLDLVANLQDTIVKMLNVIE
ncbi:phospho-sugar mutase [Bacillus sp. JJ722]